MKKTINNRTNLNNSEVPKQKERHIVSWSQEEDDILREQIKINGTENWTIIASKFKDKTTRQCRRRWFTYLNTDFKKGGWSPEEDMLLCEAQKIFGNRWTEIAKVVSGRTDNAVKNRFTTLCKKRAKLEAVAKENKTTYINLNNKRVIFPDGLNTDGGSEATAPFKKLRSYVRKNTEDLNKEQCSGEFGVQNHQIRPPFAVIAQELHSCEVDFSNQLPVHHINEASIDGSMNEKMEGTFLKKDNPKVLALMQQEELLSSFAIKVNSEMTDQSLENAWLLSRKSSVLQDFLKQNKKSDQLTSRNPDIDFNLEKFKELVENLRSRNEGNTPFSREPDIYDSSPASSEYSSGSSLLSIAPADEICLIPQKNGHELQSNQLENGIFNTSSTNEAEDVLKYDETRGKDAGLCECSNTEFSSPRQVTPLFGSFAAAIPTPLFSESEKHFLMKTLGMESNSLNATTNPSQHHPSCKRSLLHSL